MNADNREAALNRRLLETFGWKSKPANSSGEGRIYQRSAQSPAWVSEGDALEWTLRQAAIESGIASLDRELEEEI